MSSHAYQWFLLRCVPRVDRGELVNVGVVLHCQAVDHLEMRAHVDATRLRALDPDVDVAAIEGALALIDDVCRGRTGAGRPVLESPGKRFGWLAAPRSTIIQPGPVHGGHTSDPSATLEELLAAYVC